jgi:SAM-dependent MidA family methyltransferase
MPQIDSTAILPEPPVELKQLSRALEDRIKAAILKNGPIAFSRFMEMALYEPGMGYYSAGLKKFGVGGDFVTAPESGNVFARCLALQIDQISPGLNDFRILEVGAGTGSLAVALLGEFSRDKIPDRYLILERSADLRAQQKQAIEAAHPDLIERVEWLDEPPGDYWQGIIIANEVIDALPVERFRTHHGTVQQVQVTIAGDRLDWAFGEASDGLQTAVKQLEEYKGELFPDNYISEICLQLKPWLQGLVAGLTKGCALFIDYGYSRRDYYLTARNAGSLMCHYRHRAHDNPFFYPGLQDITAWVDFTALAEAGDACGLDCAGYTNQAMFLLGCGLENVLRGMELMPEKERLELAAEVKMLTLPAEMGEKFKVMVLSREEDPELCGFDYLDLRNRL